MKNNASPNRVGEFFSNKTHNSAHNESHDRNIKLKVRKPKQQACPENRKNWIDFSKLSINNSSKDKFFGDRRDNRKTDKRQHKFVTSNQARETKALSLIRIEIRKNVF